MNEIQRSNQTKQQVIEKAINNLRLVSLELKKNESIIGAQLCQPLQKASLEQRTIGVCPKCPDGKLVVLRSKKTGKRFVGCTNYFNNKCNAAYPLPQNGIIKPLGATCKSCSLPIIAVYLKGKHPWRLCINPVCSSKGEHKS